ncbi:MAG: hypothetical protein AABX29_08990 [Nanoarchaeota archaeon]
MKLDKLISSISELAPQQKLEVLGREIKNEKTEKGKEQILLLIESAKKEQEDIEERLREVVKKPEQPLENIVSQEKPPEIEETQNKQERDRLLRIYGVEERKPHELYGVEHTKTGQEEEKKSEYKLSHEDRFTQQREQNFISDEERLRRERKKYETGIV